MSTRYPASVHELDLDSIHIAPAIVTAVQQFARSRPYRGSVPERIAKFTSAIHDIARAAGFQPPTIIFAIDERQSSGSSCYIPATRTIILRGRLSVITTLHEVAHMLFGASETIACTWSLRLFRDCFPRSWTKLRFEGHVAQAEPPRSRF